MPKTDATQSRLLTMLRRRQDKQEFHYMRREDGFYKVCKVLFIISWAASALIHLLYFFSTSMQLQVNLSHHTDALNDFQTAEVAEIRTSLYTVGVMGVILLLSLVFMLLYRPVAQMLATGISVPLLLWTFAVRMSGNLEAGQYTTFLLRHVLPLVCVLLFSLICGIIAAREKHFDKVGCRELSEKIYLKYAATAENISTDQWETILEECAIADAERAGRKGKHHKRAVPTNTDTADAKQDEV